jgi:DNA-binding Lrp family transcriptional regulator
MTTKTSDNAVLAAIGGVPISAAEIARQVGIHRSNVAPRLKRLDKARRIKSINGRWVRTDSNKSTTIAGTSLTPTQIEFCEKLLYNEDEGENCDISDDSGDIFDLLANLADIYPNNNFLRQVSELAYANFDKFAIDVDEPLTEIRKIITDEPSLSPKQYEHARKLFTTEDEEKEIYAISDEYLDDPEVATMRILEKLHEAIYPDNDFLGNLAALAVDKAEGIHSVEPTDKSLAKIREAIIGELTPIESLSTKPKKGKKLK